jgi:hypothetical protein
LVCSKRVLNALFLKVVIEGYPGAYTTRSHWVYGATGTGLCYGASQLQWPGRLFPILEKSFFLFPADDGLYQLDELSRSVVQANMVLKRP